VATNLNITTSWKLGCATIVVEKKGCCKQLKLPPTRCLLRVINVIVVCGTLLDGTNGTPTLVHLVGLGPWKNWK